MIKSKLKRVWHSFRESFLDYWRALLICPALFIYIYSNDINIISLNSLVLRKLCLHEYNQTICDSLRNFTTYSNLIQEATSQHMIWLNIAFLVPAIFAIIHLANVADRKLNYELPLMVSLGGSLIQAFINIFTTDSNYPLCFNLLILSQFLNGICGGGSLAFISSCFSHVALYESEKNDQTSSNLIIESYDENIMSILPESEKQYTVKNQQRSIRYSVLESFLLLGQFLGSLSSGYLIGNRKDFDNFRKTYIVSFMLYLIVLFYIVLLFRYLKQRKNSIVSYITKLSDRTTSQSEENEVIVRSITKKRFNLRNKFNFLYDTWSLLSKPRENNARFYLNTLLVLYFFGASISMGIMSPLQYLYLSKEPISLTQTQYGHFKAFNTMFRAVALLIILPVTKYYFNISDYVLFILGLASELLNLVIFSIAPEFKSLIWLGPIVYMFSNFYVVCIRAYGSKVVEKNEIGKSFFK
jgi:hypothetical protein